MAEFRKAERKKARLRLALCGPSGSGKTYSALLVAKGLGGRIAVIDTEKSSSELYEHLVDFDVCTMDPPFTVEKYIDAIHTAEALAYDVIIIDTISHAWAGEGGLLERHDAAAQSTGNSYTAWGAVTPLHRKFIDVMLQCKVHLIATMRSKVEYIIDKDGNGKTVIRKVGLAPVQREGMDYEFTLVFDVDAEHFANASKDRTSQFTGRRIQLDAATGATLAKWLNEGGAEPVKEPVQEAKPAPAEKTVAKKEQPPVSPETAQKMEKAGFTVPPDEHPKGIPADVKVTKVAKPVGTCGCGKEIYGSDVKICEQFEVKPARCKGCLDALRAGSGTVPNSDLEEMQKMKAGAGNA